MTKYSLNTIIFLFLILFCKSLFSQQILPLNRNLNQTIEKSINDLGANFHSSFKPYISSVDSSGFDSVLMLNRNADYKNYSWFKRKLRYENFIIVDTTDFYLTIDPLFNFSYELENSEKSKNISKIYNNTRGIIIKGILGNNLYFESLFCENQSFFNSYLNDFVSKNRIVPGQGFVKNFKTNGYDYAYATGLISYSPKKYFNFQFGHGKNFIGDGYRSLLLSDNSFNYPFFKITTNIWKLQYTNLYTTYLDLNSNHSYPGGFQRKQSTTHYLSININKYISFGMFESIIWQRADSTGSRGFDINYINPVIFYRPVEFSLGSPDNALIGSNLKIKINNNITYYSQLIIDDIDFGRSKEDSTGNGGYILNKYGYQLGIKFYDLFSIPNLYFQTEYNNVRPYVYAHKTPLQNYSHYNQALAHPFGANFKESVTILNYRFKDWFVEFKLNYAVYGADTANFHWGKDIFRSDYEAQRGFPSYNNKTGQGLHTELIFAKFRFNYLINPKTYMNVFVEFVYREEKSEITVNKASFVSFGIKTSLNNFYYDF
ncbi:MAG: hypothetical protein KAT68_06145 [Bacteroidales bacterium]|nr:hypothetical protein [Bacteroidales bacterium]